MTAPEGCVKLGVWVTPKERERLYALAGELEFGTFVGMLRAVANGEIQLQTSSTAADFAADLLHRFHDNQSPDVRAAIRTLAGAAVIAEMYE